LLAEVKSLYFFASGLCFKKSNSSKPLPADKDSWNALMIAVKVGGLESAKILLENGCDIQHQSKSSGRAALHLAVGNIPMMTLLLDGGADVDALDNDCRTPLMVSIDKRCLQSIKILLAFGAKVDHTCCYGLTPLIQLILSAQDESMEMYNILEILVDNGADVNAEMSDQVWSALTLAVHLNQTNVVKYLIKKGADVNFRGIYCISPLIRAVMDKNVAMAKLLIREGASVALNSAQGYTPLMLAVEQEDLAMVDLLLDAGADVNFQICESSLEATKEDVKLR
jgi:ankyrin repeat protein